MKMHDSISTGVHGNFINLERLIYLNPNKTIDIEIATDKDNYEPGDQVEMNFFIDEPPADSNEEFFLSVSITDISSF